MNIFFVAVFVLLSFPLHAEVHLSNARIGSAVLSIAAVAVVDPCAGKNVGDACTNGVLYAGTGFAGLGSWKYMTTPGNCTDSTTPTCNGNTDALTKAWANNSGTKAYGVNTGAISTSDGAANTDKLTTLAPFYTDTDAARYCQDMTYPAGGYTDWYLPAKDELNLVLYAMYVAGKGSLKSGTYWSSTQQDNNNATTHRLNTGAQSFNLKTTMYTVRCVRKY